MTIQLRKCLHVVLISCASAILSSSVEAALVAVVGRPVAVYADPSDVVVQLDVAGPCGSNFFHIQRANLNFKELTAAALTAFAAGKRMLFFADPTRCVVNRHVVSHGAAID
jgi:hypothetical protein